MCSEHYLYCHVYQYIIVRTFVEYDMINVLIGDIQNRSQRASC